MVQDKVEVRTDNVSLLIGMLKLLENKNYLGQTVLSPNESLDLILDLKEKNLLRLTISKRLNASTGIGSGDRDQRTISISDTNRSIVNLNDGIVIVYDYGQQYMSSIKSIREAVEKKLTEIKKDIENSVK